MFFFELFKDCSIVCDKQDTFYQDEYYKDLSVYFQQEDPILKRGLFESPIFEVPHQKRPQYHAGFPCAVQIISKPWYSIWMCLDSNLVGWLLHLYV